MGHLSHQAMAASVPAWKPADAGSGGLDMKLSGTDPADLRLQIDRVMFETRDVVVLDLVRPDGAALPEWAPGAHVDLVLESGKVRQYSLCGDPADLARYRVAVLREAAGRGGSEEIHLTAKAGTEVGVRGPRNHFRLVDAPRYLFLAGGIGITPILPMIRQVSLSGRPWRLVYGGRSRSSMALLAEVAACRGGDVVLHPQDEAGLPDIEALVAKLEQDAVIYGCGPEGMLKALEAAAAGHDRAASLHVERFGASEDAPDPAGQPGDQPFEVELRQSGLVLQVPADRRLGDVLLDADIPVPFSCQEGYCGSCETRVLEGVPDHRDTILNEEEKAAGTTMMVCCGRSRTPRLVLDL